VTNLFVVPPVQLTDQMLSSCAWSTDCATVYCKNVHKDRSGQSDSMQRYSLEIGKYQKIQNPIRNMLAKSEHTMMAANVSTVQLSLYASEINKHRQNTTFRIESTSRRLHCVHEPKDHLT
jgi:hypothetical protein